MMPNNTNFKVHGDADAKSPALKTQKWGGLASFMLAVACIVAPLIYLFGDLRDAIGRFGYALADFLYGPVWAACLVTMVFALREQIGERAPHVTGTAVCCPCSRSDVSCRLYTRCQSPLPFDPS